MGKSASSEILGRLGVPLVDSDVLARELVVPGQPALEEIREAFGAGVLSSDGTLDRARVAERVFGDAGARVRLEGILHPRIRSEWKRRLAEWEAGGEGLAVVVIPLLFETGAEVEFDRVMCVACSERTQWERLLRRGWSEEECRGRIAAQMPIGEKVRRADYMVWTEPPLLEHELQVRLILGGLGGGVGGGRGGGVGGR